MTGLIALTPAERAVLDAINEGDFRNHGCRHAQATIAARKHLSRVHVNRCCQHLERLGLISIDRGKRGECNTYRHWCWTPTNRNDVVDECRRIRHRREHENQRRQRSCYTKGPARPLKGSNPLACTPSVPSTHCHYVSARHKIERTRVIDENLIDKDGPNGCWLWNGRRNRLGYGVVRHHPGSQLVHRIVFEHYRGSIPDGLVLDHLCQNPPCCNPDHLEPVSHVENIRRGPRAKLTREIVEDIRRRRAAGETCSSIGERYGINSGHVSRVERGLRWGDAA